MSDLDYPSVWAARRRIAHFLHARGTTPTGAVAAALGLRPVDVRRLTNCPWFKITWHGWALTRHGQAEGLGRRALAAA